MRVAVDDLWARFVAKREPQLRQELIIRYAPLVKYVIGRMAINAPSIMDADDIVSHGIIGLIHAIDRFDPSYGVKFETYAIARIRGSILDAFRELHAAPRSVAAKAVAIEKALAFLEQEYSRSPTDAEMAEHLGISVEQYQKMVAQVSLHFLSLDSPLELVDGDNRLTLSELIPDDNSPDPVEEARRIEVKEALMAAIAGLPERDRLVISLYYYERLTLREISQVMGISESRVHQLHTRAILRLRAALRNLG